LIYGLAFGFGWDYNVVVSEMSVVGYYDGVHGFVTIKGLDRWRLEDAL